MDRNFSHHAMLEKSRLVRQIYQIIKKENDHVESNRKKGIGRGIAFERYKVNLDPLKPLKDSSGKVIEAITIDSLQDQLHQSLLAI
jgi:hypothetical protein